VKHIDQTKHLGTIDRTANRPVYQQIAALLSAAIQRRRYVPGDRLPSEAALVAHFGVARMTVRHAIEHLLRSGLVRAEHGRGVFVVGQDQSVSPIQPWGTSDVLAVVALIEHLNGRVLNQDQYAALQNVYRAARARRTCGPA
jgi:DNA-binding FadR family transcriptional regulator